MKQELYEQIRSEMRSSFKDGYRAAASLLKVLISDIQRDRNKDYSDEKVIAVITKTIKLLKESHQEFTAEDIRTLQAFLPKEIAESAIIDYLDTIAWGGLRSPKQAVGMVMKYFPKGSVSGGEVSELVDSYVKEKNLTW